MASSSTMRTAPSQGPWLALRPTNSLRPDVCITRAPTVKFKTVDLTTQGERRAAEPLMTPQEDRPPEESGSFDRVLSKGCTTSRTLVTHLQRAAMQAGRASPG